MFASIIAAAPFNDMSYLDFAKGVSTTPFIQRKRHQQLDHDDLLVNFKESERRLNILRTFGGHLGQLPTDEEMKNWFRSLKQP